MMPMRKGSCSQMTDHLKPNAIVSVATANIYAKDGKIRPVLILTHDDESTTILKITSQYDHKSEYIKAQLFPVWNWRKIGLDKQSYIDIRSAAIIRNWHNFSVKYIGKLSTQDKNSLAAFIESYSDRIKDLSERN